MLKNSLFILTLASLFSVVTCAAAEKHLEEHHVIILHKGDPFPAPGVLYSYDSPETEKDFDRRRKEQESKTIRKEDVTLNKPAQKTCLNG